MKRTFIILLFLTPVLASAQYSRKGLYAGIGLGEFYYNTHWYYHSASGTPYYDNYPGHSTEKTTLILSLEQKSVFNTKTIYKEGNPSKKWYIDFDLGGELQLGALGKTTANWLPGDEVISGGGLATGINTYIRGDFVMPDQKNKDKNTVFFLSLGPGITMLHNNGKDVGEFASRTSYHYTDGWNEYLYMLNFSAGAKFEFGDLDVSPELRLTFPGAAAASTSWEPNGNVTADSAPTMWGFSLRLSKRIGGGARKKF